MPLEISTTQPASNSSISRLEEVIGRPIPNDWREFLSDFDGVEPPTNIFRIDDSNESGVNQFIPAGKILEEKASTQIIPESMLPIAWAEGGNLVLLDAASEWTAVFWDHETNGISRLASSFSGFLEGLSPFSVKDVQLKPGQVKAVWVDPALLEEFGEG